MPKISLVICSRNKSINHSLRSNLSSTIGLDHEIIILDNSKDEYSIFQAYNIGIEKSSGEILCFLHDDILIKTNNWGNTLINIFNNTAHLGVLGVAGSKIKSKTPSSWWECPDKYKVINITHVCENVTDRQYQGFSRNLEEVVVVDGVFLACKSVPDLKFSSDLKGFHFYDLDICARFIKQGYKNFVTNEIDITHFSKGNIDRNWVVTSIKAHNLYRNDLPFFIDNDLEKRKLKYFEFFNAVSFYKKLVRHRLYFLATLYFMKIFFKRPFSRYNIENLKYLILPS